MSHYGEALAAIQGGYSFSITISDDSWKETRVFNAGGVLQSTTDSAYVDGVIVSKVTVNADHSTESITYNAGIIAQEATVRADGSKNTKTFDASGNLVSEVARNSRRLFLEHALYGRRQDQDVCRQQRRQPRYLHLQHRGPELYDRAAARRRLRQGHRGDAEPRRRLAGLHPGHQGRRHQGHHALRFHRPQDVGDHRDLVGHHHRPVRHVWTSDQADGPARRRLVYHEDLHRNRADGALRRQCRRHQRDQAL